MEAASDAAQLAEVLESISDAFYAIDGEWRFTYVNHAAERVWGQPRHALIGRHLLECFPQTSGTDAFAILVEAMERRRTARGEVRSPVVGEWLDVHAHPKADGGISVYFSVITERIRAADHLRAREAELARVQRIGGIAGVEADLTNGFRSRRSPEYQRLHGLPPEAVEESHAGWVARVHPEDRQHAERALLDAVQSGALEYHAEYRIIRPSDAEVRWISVKAEIERDAAGRPLRLFGAHIDITDRKKAEAEREALLNALREERAVQMRLIHELNHRVKNTLAVVQSIVRQTLLTADSLAHGRSQIDSRLVALARAHDLLTRTGWGAANLAEIVADTLAGHAAEQRCSVSGPSVDLPPGQALAMAMALHEMFANARRHGALSSASGHIDLRWSITPDGTRPRLSLVWQESGGPEVVPPTRRGFGTRLIENGLVRDLGGPVTMEFLAEGLRCSIVATLNPIEPDRTNGGE